MLFSSWASCIIQTFLKTRRPRFYLPKLAKLTLYSVTIETGEFHRYLKATKFSYSSLDVPTTVAFSPARPRCLKGKGLPPVRLRPKVLVPITPGNHAHGHLHENHPPITPTVLNQNPIPVFNKALIRGRANPILDLSTMMYWRVHDEEQKRLSKSWIIYDMSIQCLERCS